MTEIEDRLRAELPELASALIAERPLLVPENETAMPVASPQPVLPKPAGLSRRRMLVGAAALTGVAAVGIRSWETSDQLPVATSEDITFGTWSVMADAPIGARPFAVSVWTGSRALFWAGSNAERDLALSDGAFYDPSSDSWEQMESTQTGHPGLAGVYLDDQIFAVAKGSAQRIDPSDGSSVSLAPAPMNLHTMLEVDGQLWGVGPASVSPSGAVTSVARYDTGRDEWDSLTEQKTASSISEDLGSFRAIIASFGDEIFICAGSGDCLAFDTKNDPAQGAWRFIGSPTGAEVPATVAVTDAGLARLELAGKGLGAFLHVLVRDSWEQRNELLPVVGLADSTIVPAGDWLMVFSGDQPPVAVHIASGDWQIAEDWPLSGVRDLNTVWTGELLVAWGGTRINASDASGAVWTPPT